MGRGAGGGAGAVVEDYNFVDGEDGEGPGDGAAEGGFEVVGLAAGEVRSGKDWSERWYLIEESGTSGSTAEWW